MESIVRCITAGADDYLPKPSTPSSSKPGSMRSSRRSGCATRRRRLPKRSQGQAEELKAWNDELEQRVEAGMQQVERLTRPTSIPAASARDLIVSGGEEQLASHRSDITVLFCDLRGFTSFSETSETEDVMTVLHETA